LDPVDLLSGEDPHACEVGTRLSTGRQSMRAHACEDRSRHLHCLGRDVFFPAPVRAQNAPSAPTFTGPDAQKRANGVLALLSFTVTPDLSASSLGIRNAQTSNPSLSMSQVGGGFTLSQSFPLYLEGAIGGSRYDPTFIVPDGQEQRALPTRWTNVAATGGIGWDFPLNEKKDLVIRPIFIFSLGEVLSDAPAAQLLVNRRTDKNVDFIKDG
jgi:hypothetical protein